MKFAAQISNLLNFSLQHKLTMEGLLNKMEKLYKHIIKTQQNTQYQIVFFTVLCFNIPLCAINFPLANCAGQPNEKN